MLEAFLLSNIALDKIILMKSPSFTSCIGFKHVFVLTEGHPPHIDVMIPKSLCW